MGKVEYSDLYKFMVSAGVALITLAFIAPWLFFREPFDLLVETSKLNSLTYEARWMVERRQAAVFYVGIVILVLAIISFGSGAYLVFTGVKSWKKVQKVADDQAEANLEKTRLENKKLIRDTPPEVLAEKADAAFNPEGELETKAAPTPVSPDEQPRFSSPAARMLNIESRAIDILARNWPESEVLRFKTIGSTQFDAIVQVPRNAPFDIIIEVKYAGSRSIVRPSWVEREILHAAYLVQVYQNVIQRRAKTHLVFVAPIPEILEAIEHQSQRILETSPPLREAVLVQTIPEGMITALDQEGYSELARPPQRGSPR